MNKRIRKKRAKQEAEYQEWLSAVARQLLQKMDRDPEFYQLVEKVAKLKTGESVTVVTLIPS